MEILKDDAERQRILGQTAFLQKTAGEDEDRKTVLNDLSTTIVDVSLHIAIGVVLSAVLFFFMENLVLKTTLAVIITAVFIYTAKKSTWKGSDAMIIGISFFGRFIGTIRGGVGYILFGFLMRRHEYLGGSFEGKIENLIVYPRNKDTLKEIEVDPEDPSKKRVKQVSELPEPTQENLSRDLENARAAYFENKDEALLFDYELTLEDGSIFYQFDRTKMANFWKNAAPYHKEMTDTHPNPEKLPWFGRIHGNTLTTLGTLFRYEGFEGIMNSPDLNREAINTHLEICKMIQPDDDLVEVQDTLEEDYEMFGILDVSINLKKVTLPPEILEAEKERKTIQMLFHPLIEKARGEAIAKLKSEEKKIQAEVKRTLEVGQAEAKAENVKITKRHQAFTKALEKYLDLEMKPEVANHTAKLVADLYTNENLNEIVGLNGAGMDSFLEKLAGVAITIISKIKGEEAKS